MGDFRPPFFQLGHFLTHGGHLAVETAPSCYAVAFAQLSWEVDAREAEEVMGLAHGHISDMR